MQYAVLFPGQGSQSVGMGADLFEMRPDLLGSAANEVLGWSLAELCAEGPEDELVRTDRAQPALYAVAYALWEAFSVRASHPPVAAAGHSLGEYTAHAAAGSVSYLDGLRLVSHRGMAMAKATQSDSGTMAAVMGADLDTVESVVAGLRSGGEDVWVANINAPGQVVVAGAVGAVDGLIGKASDYGLRRVIKLKVAGAFHTPMMQSAADKFSAALEGCQFDDTAFPVWSNALARPADDIADSLIRQLTGEVRFSETLINMRDYGVEAFVHIGPGDVTAGMAKRSVKGATVITVSSLDDIGPAVAELAVP